jgi:hypothetical protein
VMVLGLITLRWVSVLCFEMLRTNGEVLQWRMRCLVEVEVMLSLNVFAW